jgi:hypothetical protein
MTFTITSLTRWSKFRRLRRLLSAIASNGVEAADVQSCAEAVGNYVVVIDNAYLGLAVNAHGPNSRG